MITNVSLDYYGTIAQPNENYAKLRTEFLSDFFKVTPEVLNQKYKEVKKYIDWVLINDNHVAHLETLSSLAKKLNHSGGESTQVYLSQTLEQLFFENPPIISEKVLSLISQLQNRGLVINIASNTHFSKGRWIKSHMSNIQCLNLFNFTLFSDEIGYSKPQFGFFRTLVDRAGVMPENICHVGDSLACDGAAAKFGLKFQETQNLANTLQFILDNPKAYSK